MQDLKLEYYHYMITIGLHDGNYLDVCRYYRAIFETPKIQADKGRASEVCQCANCGAHANLSSVPLRQA